MKLRFWTVVKVPYYIALIICVTIFHVMDTMAFQLFMTLAFALISIFNLIHGNFVATLVCGLAAVCWAILFKITEQKHIREQEYEKMLERNEHNIDRMHRYDY